MIWCRYSGLYFASWVTLWCRIDSTGDIKACVVMKHKLRGIYIKRHIQKHRDIFIFILMDKSYGIRVTHTDLWVGGILQSWGPCLRCRPGSVYKCRSVCRTSSRLSHSSGVYAAPGPAWFVLRTWSLTGEQVPVNNLRVSFISYSILYRIVDSWVTLNPGSLDSW